MANALISVVVQQLATYVQEEVNLVVGVREEVRDLTNTRKLVQAVLADAEKKQVKNLVVRVWLEELRNVIYRADDILDEWRIKTRISQVRGGDALVASSSTSYTSKTKKVLSLLLPSCHCFKDHVIQLQVRYDISHKIKEIRQSLDKISEMRVQYRLVVSENQDEPPRYPIQLTSSIIDTSEIYGRGNDIKTIKNMVVGESSHDEGIRGPVHVISIVAMGGLGKTALAKLVYNDKTIVKAFEKRIWVCISQPFELSRIAKEIIEQAVDDNKDHIPNVWGEALRQQLSKSLKGKRFLIFLDDVWTEDKAHWEPLKLSLDGGMSGSWVVVTTRSDEVAHVVGSSYKHPLGKLSEDESWSLLRHVALKGVKEDEVEKFKLIGQQITKKCDGSPLAIHVLGSLLCQKRRVADWRDVDDSELWELHGGEDKLFPSLFMSFNLLPSISKQCFMYCVIFPKYFEIEKDLLVKLWMAQGFLEIDGNDRLETIGEKHFGILAMRSFFQDFKKDPNGNITSCKMHDIVHDFAQFLTQKECCNTEEVNAKEFDVNRVRHLWTLNLENPAVYEAKNLRTLVTNISEATSTLSLQLFDRLLYLRALDLSESHLENLPNGVDNLLHLRYLDVSATKLIELPETICNLYNLQTLKLNRCEKLCKLPERIVYLYNLRHLEIRETYKLSYLPHEIKRLSSLQTLSKFTVGGPNSMSEIKDLRLLNNLSGDLEILGLHRVRDANEAAQAELSKKKNLRTLTLGFELIEDDDVRKVMENVLENLEPHEDIERLCINQYPGYRFPNWMHSKSLLYNIVDMELLECANCIELPPLGNLASLEVLRISKMHSVKVIGNEFYGCGVGNSSSAQMTTAFPKLKKLEIRNMENWEEWELPISNDMIKIMPYLSEVRLCYCLKLNSLRALGRLESLEVLEISSMHSVKVIGSEFYGWGVGSSSSAQMTTAFPKLKKLEIRNMENLEKWELPISNDVIKIMPYLSEVRLHTCGKLNSLLGLGRLESLEILSLEELPCLLEVRLRYCSKLISLPGLARLESLEILELKELPAVKCVGPEFLGISPSPDADDGGFVPFPKLKELQFYFMRNMEQWIITLPLVSLRDTAVIMPHLRDLQISGCFKLRELPDLSLLKSLETLRLVALFEWEGPVEEEESNFMPSSSSSSILHSLVIEECPKLKVIPRFMLPPTLSRLVISNCRELRLSEQTCLPSLLEELILSGDAGIFSKSLHLNNKESQHITSLKIYGSPHPSPPEGFNQLKALQKLQLYRCESLDFHLVELQQLTMLRELLIDECPLLTKCFQGDEWRRILSHVPYIRLDFDEIKKSS